MKMHTITQAAVDNAKAHIALPPEALPSAQTISDYPAWDLLHVLANTKPGKQYHISCLERVIIRSSREMTEKTLLCPIPA